MYVVSTQQMRDIDRFTIEQIGIPSLVLMENAGVAVVREVEKRWPTGKVVVLAGPGNNGGDGLVIARHLLNEGREVTVWLFGREEKRSEDCRRQLEIIRHSGYSVTVWEDGSEEEKALQLQTELGRAAVVVDALLGTGTKGELRPPYPFVIEQLQNGPGTVVAVDIPTGVNSDTGEVAQKAVRADVTVTFAFPKWGHFLYPGADCVGELVVADISIPRRAAEEFALRDAVLIGKDLRKELPVRRPFSHKGTYGHALVLAGSKEMTGAPVLAASAGLHTGCGLLTLAVPSPALPIVASKINEPVFWEWPAEKGHFSSESYVLLKQRLASFDVVSIGPGLGTWDGGHHWLKEIIRLVEVPLVLDADALNLLAEDVSILQEKKGQIILTPHPGEMGRLCGCTAADIEKDRIGFARMFAQKHDVYVVLKGTYTLIATPDGRIFVNPTGTAALAKGGTGDVLTGMLAGMLAQKAAQGQNIETGIQLAVYLHGLAGRICGETSMYATLASDVIDKIGSAIKRLSFAGDSHVTDFPGN
ncbi:NAD(P)H-hydrate dehydratase [Aneurinibacillus danicus]|jgi:NAD(P)H-hydrate epimerase|uniref:Bifunctional NAD(P)H-hydrate repair enzyme n=1 Tax=Aneurinibacillus danicus TaxID=267746 RepID=A0A511VF56_9BACL|nr:NAD(P)H-hydrate dehydratase [Aneurinibacillus danicus]GEN35912.1 bifunctional ADP-dependent NAD(P)H-hydrate dehydratase/NAD(P)H-hydrate epimerase [Aneurinibacillus danicus]